MIREAIQRVVDGYDLTEQEAAQSMAEIFEGQASPAQIGAFLTALRIKGETVDEILGCARVMREKATRIPHHQELVVDTCGTGGDNSGTFNISTTAAFVVAGAGARVAKHGNRAMTSRSGSADCLAALGVQVDIPPEKVARCLDEVGIGFLFAPALHGSMKHAVPVRREIGIRTLFNVLGPLTNPAGATCQLMGVYDPDLCEKLAFVLGKLGARHVMVVSGLDGLDEITTCDETAVAEFRDGKVRNFHVGPEEFGLEQADPASLRGGTPEENAVFTRQVLEGAKGAKRDVVLLNAAAALVTAGLAPTLAEGLGLAAESLDTGRALEKLDSLIRTSKS